MESVFVHGVCHESIFFLNWQCILTFFKQLLLLIFHRKLKANMKVIQNSLQLFSPWCYMKWKTTNRHTQILLRLLCFGWNGRNQQQFDQNYLWNQKKKNQRQGWLQCSIKNMQINFVFFFYSKQSLNNTEFIISIYSTRKKIGCKGDWESYSSTCWTFWADTNLANKGRIAYSFHSTDACWRLQTLPTTKL